jgi:hypothetical protein
MKDALRDGTQQRVLLVVPRRERHASLAWLLVSLNGGDVSMLRCKHQVLAIAIAGALSSAAAAKGAHPLAGSYSGEIYGSQLFLEILENGRVNGAWGHTLDSAWIGSGRIDGDGVLRMTLKFVTAGVNGRKAPSFEVIGRLDVDESGSLVGIIQFGSATPQIVVLVRH